MDGDGLWRLFFATGSPLVWLVLRRQQEAEQAQTAFRPLGGPNRTI